jgi:hypothetical protein
MNSFNPLSYLKAFAWIVIVALCCFIVSEFWIPMLVGAVIVTILYKLVR